MGAAAITDTLSTDKVLRERSGKSAEKRKQRAENDPEYAKYIIIQ